MVEVDLVEHLVMVTGVVPVLVACWFNQESQLLQEQHVQSLLVEVDRNLKAPLVVVTMVETV